MGVIEWLMQSDPSIRWQAMRDLRADSASIVAEERSRVAEEGWGARLLGLQAGDGRWGGGVYQPKWISTYFTLLLLRDLGADPESEETSEAVSRVRDNVTWEGVLPQDAEWHGRPFFDGEVEPCINGMVLATGSYFGVECEAVLERLLSERLPDGGWNCEAPASQRTSFDTTICVLEGLWEYERAHGPQPAVAEARAAAEEYMLERRMLRSLSTGRVINPEWALFSFPTRWHYDVLRGLDYLRDTGIEPDSRLDEALEIVLRNRGDDGRWPLQNTHPGKVHFAMEDGDGDPSRWNTLRALRVLKWAGVSANR